MLRASVVMFCILLGAQSAAAEEINTNPFKHTCMGLTKDKHTKLLNNRRPQHLKLQRVSNEMKNASHSQGNFLNDYFKIRDEICESVKLKEAMNSMAKMNSLKIPKNSKDCEAYQQVLDAQKNAAEKLKAAQTLLKEKIGDDDLKKAKEGTLSGQAKLRNEEHNRALNEYAKKRPSENIGTLHKEARDIFSPREEKSFFRNRRKELDDDFTQTDIKINSIEAAQITLKNVANSSGLTCNFK